MSHLMILRSSLNALVFASSLAVVAAGGVAYAQGKDTFGVPSIMQPEPGSLEAREETRPAKPSLQREVKQQRQTGRRVRGSSSPSPVPQYQSPPRPDFSQKRSIDGPGLTAAPDVPTPVPGFARVPAPPSYTGQTFQDKAIGCAHYGASQGIGAGQIGAYTGGCVNTR